MIVFLGDLHFRPHEPFYSSQMNFINWFASREFNNKDNVLIQTGDLLHTAKSDGKTNLMMVNSCFNQFQFKKIFVIQGNHDYSKRDGSGLVPLSAFNNVEIVDRPQKRIIEGKKFLFLPFYYPNSNNLPPMQEYYANLPDEFREDHDCIVGHYQDETETYYGRGIDTSYLKGKRIHGHIHRSSPHYIGTPYSTRYDEKDGTKKIMCFDNDKWNDIEVPELFLRYEDVTYGEDVHSDPSKTIYYFTEAPDRDSVLSMYKHIQHIGRITYKRPSNATIIKDEYSSKLKTNHELMEDYCKIHEVDGDLKRLLLENVKDKNNSRGGD
jgi:hypothetical protein